MLGVCLFVSLFVYTVLLLARVCDIVLLISRRFERIANQVSGGLTRILYRMPLSERDGDGRRFFGPLSERVF